MIDSTEINNSELFNKTMKSYRNTGRIKQCFHHRNDECNGEIKQSHSLQRNGRLSVIEGDVKGNQSIYTFTSFRTSEKHFIEDLKPIGKKEASTFFGFCDHHDTVLFSPIENSPYDDSSKHNFLHSYRSFAHSYHKKIEQSQALQANSEYTRNIPFDTLQDMREGNKMALKDTEARKKYLDGNIESESYDSLIYFTYIKEGLYPWAVSSQLSPRYSYTNKPMNNHLDPSIPFSQPMLTLLPDKDETIVIFSAFPDDDNALLLMEELEELSDLKLEKAITSLIISNCENTFFAPAVWASLSKKEKRLLLDEFTESTQMPQKKFFHSSFNFFDNRFEAKRLGIIK